jgi:exodeoxyribonuclease V gamma subunit
MDTDRNRPLFTVTKRPSTEPETPPESAPPRILPHDNFEGLIGALCREMDGSAPSPRPQTMVVPSVAFKDYLQTGIARARGICMGLDLPTAAVFVARVTDKQDDSPWSKENLEWRILPHAREFAVQLGVDPVNASTRELFAVSSLLADQIDQYGHFRPEMIRAWDKEQFFLGKDHADEKWQRKLWTKLKNEIGGDHPHPAVALARLRQDPVFGERVRREYPSVTVIGSGTIDPLMVEVLKMLQEAGSKITVHVLVPTQHYLADLKSRTEVLKQLRDEPDSFAHEAGHPLLTSMGRHAAGAFCLLQELDENLPEWRIDEPPVTQAAGSLLNQVQSGIRHLSPPQQTEQEKKHPNIGVHSCFGPRREMEVLRDEILRAFKELPDLQPSDIHIVTPSLDAYAPLVPAALELSVVRGAAAEWTETPLRVRVTEAPKSGHKPLIAAMLALLEMAAAESYAASSLLELLHLEPVRRALSIKEDEENIEQLRSRIRDSGITNGLRVNDGQQGIGTWPFARERLIAGLWMGPEGTPLYPAKDGESRDFVLPVAEDLAGDTALVRSFVAWWSDLEAAMREWAEPALSSEWVVRLRNVLSILLGCRDGEELTMRSHLLFLESVSCDVKIDAGTVLDWLDAATAEERRRNPFSGKIAFGRFRQLQNLPCRVLAMVGMQEGTFPAANRVPAWDLLQSKPKPWDRNPRIDDRQLFLDAILAPTDRLIITGATRNVRTNESEPFSPCVDELLRVVAILRGGDEGIVTEHPLQPFSQEYFRQYASLQPSFSKTNAKVALGIAAAEGERRPQPFHDAGAVPPAIAEPATVEITIAQLASFWKDPAKAFVRSRSISVWEDEEDDRDLDFSPAGLDGLQEWKVKDAIVREIVEGDGDLKAVKARLRANRQLPKGLLGDRVWDELKRAAKALGSSVRDNYGAVLPINSEVEMVMESYGFPDLKVKITGQLRLNKAGDHLLVWRAGKADKNKPNHAKHYIEPWLSALFAAQQSEEARLPTIFLNAEQPAPTTENTYPEVLSKDGELNEVLELTKRIQDLVAGYLIGRVSPLCYAPATSDEIAKHLAGTSKTAPLPLADAMAKARQNQWEPDQSGDNAMPGEGESEVARLAWRDTDPFANSVDWNDWVEKVAKPLRRWRKL